MIDKLTAEQKSQLDVYSKKWIEIGLSTTRANREFAEKWCREAYKVVGMDEPKLILWAESPIGLLLTAKVLKVIQAEMRMKMGKPVQKLVADSVWDSVWESVWESVASSVGESVGDSVRASVRVSVGDSLSDLKKEWDECKSWGQHDAYWLGFYDYFRRVVGLHKDTEKLVPLTELAKETGWHIFYKDVAILSEKPTEISRNERGQLHNFHGPAIKWTDGYQLYRFNGVRLDGEAEKYVNLSKDEITKEMFTKEKNADIRRELIRKVGNERLIDILDYKIIDSMDEYELISFDIGDGRVRPFLKMKCATTSNIHIEGVLPEIDTVKKALAYKFNQTEWHRPLMEG